MDIQTCVTQHLVKSEDLNHHGTLYAGRTAEWFVESGFIAAATLTKPDNIVCLMIHGMHFSAPVHRGQLARFDSRVVYTGTTRIVSHIRLSVNDTTVVQGFITFIHVDLEGKSIPHGIVITPRTDEEKKLYEQAEAL